MESQHQKIAIFVVEVCLIIICIIVLLQIGKNTSDINLRQRSLILLEGKEY